MRPGVVGVEHRFEAHLTVIRRQLAVGDDPRVIGWQGRSDAVHGGGADERQADEMGAGAEQPNRLVGLTLLVRVITLGGGPCIASCPRIVGGRCLFGFRRRGGFFLGHQRRLLTISLI